MISKLRREFTLVVAVVASALMAAFAFFDLSVTASYSPYLTMKSLFDRGQPVSPAAVVEYTRRLSQPPETCRSDIWNAAIRVATQNIRQEEASPDRRSWRAALRAIEPLLRDGLACMPANGELWARMAEVRWFLGGSGDEQAFLMNTSQAYSPAEIRALELRIIQWRRLTPYVLRLTEAAMRSDLRIVLNYAPPASVKLLFQRIPDTISAAVRDELSVLPPERRKILTDAGIDLSIPV